jgi:hypothetical protein
MSLELFQEATVVAAVEALTDAGGSRRFLIADEVGLGKTVSAKAIAERLRARRRRPLNIVYLCPNLEIAAQNLTKLGTLQPGWKQPADRLSLVAAEPLGGDPRYRVFCYTPDTSLPGWRGGSRTGRAPERSLIASLLARRAPRSWLRIRAAERKHEEDGKPRRFPHELPDEPKHLGEAFEQALRRTLRLGPGDFDEGLGRWLDDYTLDIAELILRSRAALALAALAIPACRPDLVILDEFHRFADLIVPQEQPDTRKRLELDRRHLRRLLVEALCGKGRTAAAMLLLSATPYRLQSADRKSIAGSRYEHFSHVVNFLMGGTTEADRSKVVEAIDTHHRALGGRGERQAALAEVGRAKRAVEALLRPYIARTERATDIEGELFDRIDQPATIEARDLQLFRHLAVAARKAAPKLTSWVQPLWSSIPYPAELLQRKMYKIAAGLDRSLPPVTIASEGGNPAHPRLRALVRGTEETPPALYPEALSLPWIVPTRPWWPCAGRWAQRSPDGRAGGKAMIFSRYKGTPPSVSAWLSAEVDRTAARHQKRDAAFKSQAYLRPDVKHPWPLAAMFMPWPRLSGLIDPGAGRHSDGADLQKAMKADLRTALKKAGVRVARRKDPARKAWQLAFAIERKLEGQAIADAAIRKTLGRKRVEAWGEAGTIEAIGEGELSELTRWLVGMPGPVVARLLKRHDPDLLMDADGLIRSFKFSFGKLRAYLGQRYFASAVLGGSGRKPRGGYPAALRQAIVDGGLEASLDEHLAVMAIIGDQSPIEILESSLLGRPGRVPRRTTRRTGHARVHVAIPFVGADRRSGNRDDKLRSDAIRRAFNSPFWPHAIATTSVGQEGLDFHVWCDRIIHWDLPRDPVDFEQREGRIARYGSICVRRALAKRHDRVAVAEWQSPFAAILAAARAAPGEGLGLARWWAPPGNLPSSITFALPFSLGAKRLAELRDDLVTYRLALGQPEPKRFEEMIKHFGLDHRAARALALNLSPAVALEDHSSK